MLRLVCAALLSVAATAFASTDPTYTALRAARPDGRVVAVKDFAVDRDTYHITLNGSLYLLAPVNDATVGAVFVGSGAYTLTPATDDETRQLRLESGDDKLTALSDTFDSAVFFDAPMIKAAEAASAAKTAAVGPEVTKTFDDFLKKERKDFSTNFHIRVLQELLDPLPQPLFLGYLRGKKLPPALMAFDVRGVDSLHLFQIADGGEKTMLYVNDDMKGGIWYLAHTAAEYKSGTAAVTPHVADAERYVIDTTIAPNAEMSGWTEMTFTAKSDARVLPLSLTRSMRIDDVQFSPAEGDAAWKPAAFIQEDAEEDGDAAVIFPAAIKSGARYRLKVTYHGVKNRVLRESGDGNYTVGARESWYPNLGAFTDTADYELTFRSPQKSKNQVVAVGTEVSNKIEGDQRVAVWKSTHPLRVAGFNYGNFKKRSELDKESGVTVDVYTNPGDPDIIRQINQALSAGAGRDEMGFPELAAGGVNINTENLAQAAFADGANTMRTGNLFFGPLPDKQIAITQQSAWYYGQSWPNLVYLPYLAFVGSTVRNMMGFGLDMTQFVDQVGAHEVAHQWWGHQVGWNSYHDEWISEGFAEFTSGLVLEARKGSAAMNSFYEQKRKRLLEKSRGAHITTDQAGPITQGLRLSTWQAPGAYGSVVYDKGAYVLHMLRMTMRDTKAPVPDQPFIDMMKDFAATYAGKNASTDDFQHIVEKHATKTLKLTKDGKLDWFFGQWVHGTMIPRLTSKLDVTPGANGKYHIAGSITQAEVNDNFATVVPIYIVFDKGTGKLGELVLVGNSTKPVDVELALPAKPKSVVINAMHDVLSR
jgi:hypothetical protein